MVKQKKVKTTLYATPETIQELKNRCTALGIYYWKGVELALEEWLERNPAPNKH